ncbi:kinase-like domain-containing protein [Rhodocollybia butyracea]|uniref:Kinase-like domain-containing protein n=1 Tax=Rhodocollybia butyracea TaxID=206335 RepID=A0A9P5UBS0_9AGAR|nr:kinase-like domain-containing protein [Rhodocollybia butyracea]
MFDFQGRYENKNVAVLQLIYEGSTSNSNRESLLNEFELLIQAEGFAKSFTKRAKDAELTVPGLKYNVEGAFIGTVTSYLSPGPLPLEDTILDDERSLVHDTFLVVPLLQTKGLYKERKFSGNSETGCNGDFAGRVVDAFAHHIVEHTNGECMLADIQGIVGPDKKITLFDPQAHTKTQTSGEWDSGISEIHKFIEEHKCNEFCKQMNLRDLSKPFPLRPW